MNGFVPDGARVATGKDGSQGGMGTRGTINDGPQLSGLIVNVKREEVKEEAVDIEMDEVKEEEPTREEPMDEDQRALRALLSGSNGDDKPKIELDAIHLEDGPAWHQAQSEADAFKEDLARRPDESTLADYERVPIELFGEAMLRGMGHVPGKAASKSGAGRIEPYIPESRPALLGIGAKPRPQDENEDKNGKKRFTRPDKRYVPVVKAERNGSDASSRRTSRSRSGSPSRGSRRDRDMDRRESYREERRDKDRERDRDRDRDRDGRREKDKERERDRDRDRRDRDYDSDRTRDRRREYDSDRDRERRRDYDSDRDRRRDRDRDGRRR